MRMVLFFAWLAPALLLAQAPNTVVGVDLDTATIRIGEQVHLKMHIAYASSSPNAIQWPTVGDTLNAHLEVVHDSGIDTIHMENGLDKQVRTLTLTSFDTGFWAVPPFRFLVNDRPIGTAALLIEVRGVELDSALVIRDIKDIHTLPFSLGYWVRQHGKWIGAFAGGLALVVALLYFILSRRKTPAPKAVDPERPLHERILSALSELDKERLWQQGDHKGYHSRITDLLRGYIEERYRVPALESTTDELLSELRVSPLSADQRGQLENMLRLADMVKFAKALPAPQENEQMMVGTTRFVRDTASNGTIIHG